tara:strand:+ start:9174 stop:9647 length:474 start_codon:yes stop_codon:yes gene_type:complete
MNKNRKLEALVGLFMIIGFAALFALTMKVSNLGSVYKGSSFEVSARFDNIGGLKLKAPVTIAGVQVGRVKDIYYDSLDYSAVVILALEDTYLEKIPDDTFAKILTAGLLGEQYISLDPGGSEIFLKQDSEIGMTQSALVLEEVIGQFIFSKGTEGLE